MSFWHVLWSSCHVLSSVTFVMSLIRVIFMRSSPCSWAITLSTVATSLLVPSSSRTLLCMLFSSPLLFASTLTTPLAEMAESEVENNQLKPSSSSSVPHHFDDISREFTQIQGKMQGSLFEQIINRVWTSWFLTHPLVWWVLTTVSFHGVPGDYSSQQASPAYFFSHQLPPSHLLVAFHLASFYSWCCSLYSYEEYCQQDHWLVLRIWGMILFLLVVITRFNSTLWISSISISMSPLWSLSLNNAMSRIWCIDCYSYLNE